MGLLDRFEQSVERRLSATFSKAFRPDLKPVDLASAIRRDMDERTAALSRGRTIVPNEFTVELGPEDYAATQEWGHDVLADELTTLAQEHAEEQNYTFVGPVEVYFDEVNDLEPGQFQVNSTTRRGPLGSAAEYGPRHPIVDIDGQRYLLTGPRTVIGRGSESDIIIDDPGVSRRHLQIEVTPDGAIASDLGSTNGSFVEGHQIQAATLVDGNTITIGRTRILYFTGADSANE